MLLHVGRVDKPHGLRGEVVVSLTTNRIERVAAGSELVLAGGRVLTVVTAVPLGTRWIVQFDGVYSRNDAELIAHQDLSAEPIDDPDAIWVHELLGATVVDQHGVERGEVKEVLANPASDLLVLDTGALVPLRFVVSHDKRRITVEVPEGMFEG